MFYIEFESGICRVELKTNRESASYMIISIESDGKLISSTDLSIEGIAWVWACIFSGVSFSEQFNSQSHSSALCFCSFRWAICKYATNDDRKGRLRVWRAMGYVSRNWCLINNQANRKFQVDCADLDTTIYNAMRLRHLICSLNSNQRSFALIMTYWFRNSTFRPIKIHRRHESIDQAHWKTFKQSLPGRWFHLLLLCGKTLELSWVS